MRRGTCLGRVTDELARGEPGPSTPRDRASAPQRARVTFQDLDQHSGSRSAHPAIAAPGAAPDERRASSRSAACSDERGSAQRRREPQAKSRNRRHPTVCVLRDRRSATRRHSPCRGCAGPRRRHGGATSVTATIPGRCWSRRAIRCLSLFLRPRPRRVSCVQRTPLAVACVVAGCWQPGLCRSGGGLGDTRNVGPGRWHSRHCRDLRTARGACSSRRPAAWLWVSPAALGGLDSRARRMQSRRV